MLYLKNLNLIDIEKEYEYITAVPADENGFINELYDAPRAGFEVHIEKLMNHAKGLDLPAGYVPETHCLLWDDNTIVGWFRLRHHLCPSLINGAGHIGYSIHPAHRRRGYGTEGLRLAIEKAFKIIPENEIYLRVNKNNPASLQVMIKNGGYIHHEDDTKYYVRIQNPSAGKTR